MRPLVTISIPVYKCEEFLEKCLDSVRLQDYENLEVVLVNDQTPDNSAEIAAAYIRKHHLQGWRIIHLERNSGLSVVRNKGIDEARGKYLFFLDSDDTITPDCIAKLVGIAEANKLDMAVGSTMSINLHTGRKEPIFSIKSQSDIIRGNDEIFAEYLAGNYPESSWNKIISVDFLRTNKLYFAPGIFSQDSLQSFQAARKIESIGFVRDITYFYYLHDKSVIHNRTKKNFDNWHTIAQYIDETLRSEDNIARKRQVLTYLTDFKTFTLQMNWKAQKNPALWKESYANYQKLSTLKFSDYFSSEYSREVKKKSLFNSLPVNLGFKLFKWRYER